jgi:hypothetical protein
MRTDIATEATDLEFESSAAWVVNKLFQRSWFERTWVLQEVVLAKEAFVMCGRQEIDWEDVCKACSWMSACGLRRLIGHDLGRLIFIGALQDEFRSKSRNNTPVLGLISLLEETRIRIAADLRDKVYGLLGLSTHKGALVLDCENSITEVYIEATKVLISESQSLRVLNTVRCLKCGEDIPS